MLKNRELSIRVKKANDTIQGSTTDDKIFVDRVAFVHTVVKDVVTQVVKGVCAYVAADTVRQVLIAKSTKVFRS